MLLASNTLDNHGAMSRFRAALGVRSKAENQTRGYLNQQRLIRAINKYIPEKPADCRALSKRLGTCSLDQERVTSWIFRLTNEDLTCCIDFIEEGQPDAALLYIMRQRNNKILHDRD